MKRPLSAALFLVGTGCATTSPQAEAERPPQVITHQLFNRSEFDVMNCSAEPLTARVFDGKSITGALLAVRPLLLECLVDPKSRGPAEQTQVVVDSVATDKGVEHTVSGANLTAEGKACLEQVLADKVKLSALERGAQPVAAQVQVVHSPQANAAVQLGHNEPSDLIGHIRVAQRSWCDCYAGYKDTVPTPVKAIAIIEKGATQVSEVKLTPLGPPGEDLPALSECLTQKLRALPLPATTARWDLPYTFESINTLAAEPAAGVSDPVKLVHLDARRFYQLALTTTAIGERTGAAVAYGDVVMRFNSRRKSATRKQLDEACQVLLQKDDAWLAQLNRQLETDKQTLTTVEALAASNQGWAPQVPGARKGVADTEAELASAREMREADAKICTGPTKK
jgi:hypothetical protein